MEAIRPLMIIQFTLKFYTSVLLLLIFFFQYASKPYDNKIPAANQNAKFYVKCIQYVLKT